MPPPINPAQSSRAGLITALIVSIVVAVAMIVVAVFEGNVASKTQLALDQRTANDRTLYPEGANNDTRVAALIANKENFGASNALDAAIAQGDQLAKLVGGDTADHALTQARALIHDASERIGAANGQKLIDFTLPVNSSLAVAINSLTDQVVQLANSRQEVQSQLAAAQQKLQDQAKAQQAVLAQKDDDIKKANDRAVKAEDDAKTYQQQAAQANAALQASANGDMKKLQDTIAQLTTQGQQKDKQVKEMSARLTQLMGRLHMSRVNPNEPIVQHADGTIDRVVDQNTVFINLGRRQSVTKGLTFEVYDKTKGIPPLGNGLSDTDMPVGKASIEVFNVQADTAECRVIRINAGEQLVVGDLITNLVFDPNVRYNFFVYGNFDLSNSGAASPGDAEIVKRLITQWGGNVVDHIDINTDFVVMGKEPTIPTVTDPSDVVGMSKVKQAQDALKKYTDVIADASSLGIPTMNQNRFLYFIGYYDLAQR